MNWLRKSLLWASVGFLGTASAAAQTSSPPAKDAGVILCRPQPLTVPSGPPVEVARQKPWPAATGALFVRAQAPATTGGCVVRAQMLDFPASTPASGAADHPFQTVAQMLPDAPVLGAPASPAQLGAPVTPVQQTDAQPYGAATKAADGTRTFDAPPPTAVVPRYNPWSGVVEGLPTGTAPVITYDSTRGYFTDTSNPRFYARAEYLLWWTKGYNLPVLVTTAPATTPEALRGTLGVPGTTVLYGGTDTNNGPQSGGRFTVGWNLDPCGTCGIEASYFFLAPKHDDFFSDNAVLARPFFDVNTGTQARQLTTTPGILAGDNIRSVGSIGVNNFSDLQGAELNLRTLVCSDCTYSVYAFAGLRYLDLHEGLSVGENISVLGLSPAAAAALPQLAPGDQITVYDSFATRNRFYGGQVGLDGEYRWGNWFVGGRAQVALGVTHETVDIEGSQSITTPAGGRTNFAGGLLALPSNIGAFSQNRFSVIPQVGLKLGYNVTDNLRVFVGYEFLYWGRVLRPGDQVDTALNASQIPNFGAAPASNVVRPVVPLTTSTYYAHGVNAGLEWRY